VRSYPIKLAAAALLLHAFLAAQNRPPERTVQANIISSQRDPTLRIGLPKSVQYVGADRWVLYGIADCELHAFVGADGDKNVHRLYWVQFEGYVPTRPELEHKYASPRIARLGGMNFYVDTWVGPKNAATEPGSDLEHINALIRAKGYTLPAGMMSVRLVHLLDEQKRKELMIIYSEDVAPTGFTTTELLPGGKAYGQWPAIEKGLIERAEKTLAFEKPEISSPR
jgi:hypothetical protein